MEHNTDSNKCKVVELYLVITAKTALKGIISEWFYLRGFRSEESSKPRPDNICEISVKTVDQEHNSKASQPSRCLDNSRMTRQLNLRGVLVVTIFGSN